MKNLNLSKTRIATIVLAILLVSSTYAVFAQAQTIQYYPSDTIASSTAALSTRTDPETGIAYGDVNQYEWPSYGMDGQNTRHGGGPAPNSATELWRSNTTLYSGTFGGSACTEFNGFAYAFTGSSTLSAFNLTDGSLVWSRASVSSGFGMFGTMAPVKIDNQTLMDGSSSSLYFINCSNGALISTTSVSAIGGAFGVSSIGGGGSVSYWQVMFDPVTRTLLTTAAESGSNRHLGVAIDCSDPIVGASMKWTFWGGTGLEAMCIDGPNNKAFFGGYGEGIFFCVDLTTGKEIWHQFKNGNAGYSATVYDGIVYHAASSTEITGFDENTGAIKCTFNVAGGRAFYAYGGHAAYGRYFGDSIEVPQGWVSGWDAKTLQQQWKQPATYYISYMVGCVGDGKFFISASDQATGTIPGGVGNFNGYHFTAYDAFTGQKIWEAPYYFRMPSVAYGHLFGTGTVSGSLRIVCFGDVSGGNAAQSKDWPQFHGPWDENGTSTGTVSGNYPISIRTATWKFQADAPASGSPVVGEGKVFFGTWAGTMYAIDASKGTKIWNATFNTRILSTPTIANGYLFTGADDGNCYALNASTGAQIWKAPAGGRNDAPTFTTAWQVKCSPLYWDGMVYCIASEGNLYAFNATTGHREWVYNASTFANGQGGSMTIHKDTLNRTCLYFLAGGTPLKKVNINGTLDRSLTIGTARASLATPTIIGDYLFITYGSGTGTIAVINATYLTSIATATIGPSSISASTPMTQTPTWVASNLCNFTTNTNIGWQSSGAGYYRVNTTTQALQNLPCLMVSASTNAVCMAFIRPGTNLGNSSSNANQWIVNSTNPYFIRVWDAWAGHQVFGSCSVATLTGATAGTNAVYLGNAAYGFTAYNGTTGGVLSTYTALAQVFATAALANNNVYITGNDGYLYCFNGASQGTTSIFAASNKGTQMAVNEPTVIQGQLTGYQFFQSTFDSNNNATFHPTLPYQQVRLVWINSDGTSEETAAKTDVNGNFQFTYTPTVAGNAQWLCYFPGAVLSDGTSLGQAYTVYAQMNVLGGPSPTQTESPTATPNQNPVIPMEYIYAIIGIIVALVVIVAVVMLLRSRKK